jgi:hypothetical protein
MKFRTVIASGKEVLFAGSEDGNSKPTSAWLAPGRWKVSLLAVETYLSEKLRDRSFGDSVNCFVFCFEIADFELWGPFFSASADYVSYRPKRNEIWSVGQNRWSDVKDLPTKDQLQILRSSILTAIGRIGTKKRKPRSFDYMAFATTVRELLEDLPEEAVTASST